MDSPLNTTLGARLSAYLVIPKNFQRQRNRVNKRISKLRHELDLVTKDTKNYRAKEKTCKISQAQYKENDKFGLIVLLLAERDMLYALEIKSNLEVNKASSHETLLKTKIKRALTHAYKLINLTTDDKDTRKRIEVYIYAALIAGQLAIITKQWLKALNAYSIARCCLDYLYLQDTDKDSFIKTLCTELIEVSIDPSLNLAASQLKAFGDIKTLSRRFCHEQLFPNLSPALALIDPKFTEDITSTLDLKKDVEWRGHTAEIYNDEIALKIQELNNDKEWLKFHDANQFDTVIASWISILDMHKKDIEKNQDDDDFEQRQNRAILSTYLNYNLLFTKLKRDLLLIDQLLTKKLENNKDIVKIYQGIIQTVKELEELPGVYNDEDLHYSLEHLGQYYEYKKDAVIAESYQFNSKFAESLKIYDYINKNLYERSTTKGEEYFKVEFPFEVSQNNEVALFKSDIEKKILQSQISAQFQQTRKATCSSYTVENINKYPNGLSVINLEKIEPIMCKPVLFDIAYNYIGYSDKPKPVVNKPKVNEPSVDDTKSTKKGGGLFGLFRN
ncbi:SRP68 [Candida oxycetoniae]|uniref:Signal recognition particle subunit SRP68 n=1 Tax=Candida oxycetoniae TaxID=497107 RepID=A0AAI9SZK2_9ASCO|nr:SRP68 [Candida oxycetoniae]KAI3405672.2 SRP68 [Candida oxycetoniae]